MKKINLKSNKGISLVVLVITIIVMIILAATMVISLNNTDITNKADTAVKETEERDVKDLATIAWADAYMNNVSNIESYVINTVEEQGYDTNKFTIVADKSGIKISEGWLLKKTTEGDKIVDVSVKKGKQTIEVGTIINYMPNGVGPTSYKGGWKILGADENGRILIMSSESITGSKLTLGGSTLSAVKTNFANIETLLQNTVEDYKDGTIGVNVRSIRVEDINALTNYNNSTYLKGEVNGYGNTVSYSWDGTEYPAYTYGTMPVKNLTASHKNGFTYYDATSGSVVTKTYEAGKTDPIATITSNAITYLGESYLSNTTEAYKMLFRNKDNTANVTYWIPFKYSRTDSDNASFGMHYVNAGYLSSVTLFRSSGFCRASGADVRAVVTLAENTVLEASETAAGTYNVSISK